MQWIKENWKDIDGYSSYQVSDFGRVRTLGGRIVVNSRSGNLRKTASRYLALCDSGHGYKCISITMDSIRKSFSVHRLVAIAFIPNPENKPDVNHKDGDKSNNYASNLEWCTESENILHSVNMGFHQRGEESHHAKLNETQVIEILNHFHIHPKSNRTVIAEKYNVTEGAIQAIIFNKSWRHVKRPDNYVIPRNRNHDLSN